MAESKTKAQTNGHTNGQTGPLVDLNGVQIGTGKLKIRELVEIEKLLGRKVAVDMMTGEIGGDLMQALMWIGLRRKYPQITFEEAGEFDFEQVTDMLIDDEEEPVEGDAVDPPPAPSGNESSDGSPVTRNSRRSPRSATSTG